MDVTRRWLLIARWAEGIFGAFSLLNWLVFPWSPMHGVAAAVTWAYFLGGAVVAFILVWCLGRQGRSAWYVAAVLSAVVLLNTLASLPRWWAFLRSPVTQYVGPSVLLLPTLSALTQVIVAVCVFYTRHLRVAQRTQLPSPSN